MWVASPTDWKSFGELQGSCWYLASPGEHICIHLSRCCWFLLCWFSGNGDAANFAYGYEAALIVHGIQEQDTFPMQLRSENFIKWKRNAHLLCQRRDLTLQINYLEKDLLNKQLNISSQHNVVTEMANVGFRGINKRSSKQDWWSDYTFIYDIGGTSGRHTKLSRSAATFYRVLRKPKIWATEGGE